MLFLYDEILIKCQALVDREEVSRKEFTEMKERLHSFRGDIEGRIVDLIQSTEAKVEEIRRLINKLEVCCEYRMDLNFRGTKLSRFSVIHVIFTDASS